MPRDNVSNVLSVIWPSIFYLVWSFKLTGDQLNRQLLVDITTDLACCLHIVRRCFPRYWFHTLVALRSAGSEKRSGHQSNLVLSKSVWSHQLFVLPSWQKRRRSAPPPRREHCTKAHHQFTNLPRVCSTPAMAKHLQLSRRGMIQ